MKNMKIEINTEQPLDNVVAELEKRGYKRLSWTNGCPRYVVVTPDGYYSVRKTVVICNTTLAELKEMK